MDGQVGSGQPVSLVDLLDRLLATGVVLRGEILISVADVDLVRVSLNALLASVGAVERTGPSGPAVGPAS